MPQNSNVVRPDSPQSPHFWWIIGTLLVVIVILSVIIIRGQIYRAEDVINVISSVALLLSIILSILAIAFTYTSNNNVNSQFDKINTAASNINISSQKVSSIVDNISARLDVLERQQSLIMDKMDNKSLSLPKIAESIKNNVITESEGN